MRVFWGAVKTLFLDSGGSYMGMFTSKKPSSGTRKMVVLFCRRKGRRKEGILSFKSVYFHGTHTSSKRSPLFRNAHK